jgi:hypothetical protein
VGHEPKQSDKYRYGHVDLCHLQLPLTMNTQPAYAFATCTHSTGRARTHALLAHELSSYGIGPLQGEA